MPVPTQTHWCLAACVLAVAAVGKPTAPQPVSIVPRPLKMTVTGGHFLLTRTTKILFTRSSQDVAGVASYLAELLNAGTQYGIVPREARRSESAQDSIRLTTAGASASLGNEGYELLVTPESVLIRAPSAQGLFYGVQTLRQLLPPEIDLRDGQQRTGWVIPCVSIEDQPRYSWRGMLLDCGRHFMSKQFIERYIDLLALHKMNVFHWHLTEDQGWRIEIRKWPKLAQIGAYRGENRYGGFYTQRDVKEIVAYAKSRFVMVVPEIEMPGHCMAALASYPEFSCTGGPFKVATDWGVFRDVYCAGNDKTFEFLESVLDEVIRLFPSQYVHIGGDECPKERWQQCPKCQARIKAEGLKDEHELQSYFVKRIEKYLISKGRKLIGWDEILEGGLAPEATVQWWRGGDAGAEAARQGHDVIASPTSHCYLDYSINSIGLQRIYSFIPTPDGLPADQSAHFLGGEGNMWSEGVSEDGSGGVNAVDTMVFPRLCGLAEALWLPAPEKDYPDFVRRMDAHLQRLGYLGVKPGPGMPDLKRYEGLPVKAGEWKPDQMSTEFKTIDWDVTQFVTSPGSYEFEFRFEAGEHGIAIESAVLLMGDKEIANDTHAGWSGVQKRENSYRLTVPEFQPGAIFALRVKLRSDGGTHSAGSIWVGRLR